MHDASFLSETLIFLIAAVVVAPVFQRLRSSLVLGYLVAGVIIGPGVLSLISGSKQVHNIAELGVVFLLFTIGLELSVDRLKVIRNQIFGVGTAQVVVTSIIIAAVAYSAGFSLQTSVIIGGGLALSSTAVVLQLLSERGELASRRGRLTFAILLLQDLAVVPLLALVPAFAGEGDDTVTALLWTLGKALLLLAGVAIFGRFVVRPLFRAVAVGRSSELFAAVTLAVLLGMAWLTGTFGLSLAIGGFLAGLLLAETEYRHQVAADIQPFRGLLLGLFFMTVGISLDLGIIFENTLLVLGLLVGLIVLKTTITMVLCRISGVSSAISLNTALVLSQAGEFGFVLFALAGGFGLLEPRVATILAAVIALSMALTPGLAWLGNRAHRRMEAKLAEKQEDMRSESADMKDHVIIAGFGRVGQSVVKTLSAAGIPYVAVEFEPTRVAEARAQGLSVYYGDASRVEVLEALGAERARAAVIILDNATAAERVVNLLHRRFPRLNIFVRARDNAHKRRLVSAGASGIVHETYELSLHLGEAVLRGYGTPDDQIRDIIRDHRADDYALLSDVILPVTAEKDGEKKG
ncbi:MAG: CPA2 family monovalent cation:H+ antiporter-2 [Paracoccaceae bacterium]|jgi:CPA2 family monovalent cation:H+ antiporter-2